MKSFFEKYFNSIMPLLFIFNCVTTIVSQIIWLWLFEQENAMIFTVLLILCSVSIFICIFLKLKNELSKKDKWIELIAFIIFLIMFIIGFVANIKTAVALLLTFVSVVGICTLGNCIRLVSKKILLEFISIGIGMVPMFLLLCVLIPSALNDWVKLIISMFFVFGTYFFACIEDAIRNVESNR